MDKVKRNIIINSDKTTFGRWFEQGVFWVVNDISRNILYFIEGNYNA